MENSFRLILRVMIIIAAITLLFTLYELPTERFVGSSALVGAAIGFGSSQTINNVVAGFFVEGQVEEIPINYTKLYTPSFNIPEVPNVQVMNSRVLNHTHEGFIKYIFSMSFSHSVSNEDIVKQCIEPAMEEFHRRHEDKQLRRPEYYFETSGNFGRSFKFRIFVPRGDARTLYVLQPELSRMIVDRWDAERMK